MLKKPSTNSKEQDNKCQNLSAIVELSYEDEEGRSICFDFPISLDIFVIALIFQEACKQDEHE